MQTMASCNAASSYSGYRKSGRTIREGPVHVIYGKHNHKKRYLKAVCGSTEAGIPARLQVYEDTRSASKGKSLMCEVLFTNVEYVNSTEERHKKVVTIGLYKDCKRFSFYVADSHTSTMKWFKYCGLLFAIPHYTIPEVPQENLVIQKSIDQCKDCYKSATISSWMVYILSEGIGDVTGFIGLHVVTICDSTFNIYNFHTDKHLIAWHRDKIKLSGCIESLVFLEADETCRGGPGLLWMQNPMPQAITFQQHLHDFIFDPEQSSCKRTSLACHVLVDSAMSNAYIKSSNNPQLCHEEQPSQASLLQYDASQSSLDSQCSSGYCSDASSRAGSHGESFRLHHLKGTHKQSPNGEKKQSKDDETISKETLSDQTAYSSIDDNKCIQHSHENSSIQYCSSSYENCSPLNLQNTPPLPPKPCKKIPFYENHIITASKPNVTSERSKSFPSSEGPTCGHCTGRNMSSSSCQQAVLSAHPPQSIVSGTESPKRLSLGTTATISKHQLEKQAFQKCSVIITDNLDISAILPHLNSHGLLTDKDRQTLLNKVLTNVEKAHYLLDILPRKDSGFFETFIFCLCQSKDGTGHGDIVKALTASFKEVKESNKFH